MSTIKVWAVEVTSDAKNPALPSRVWHEIYRTYIAPHAKNAEGSVVGHFDGEGDS